jgi:hypothetical protein
MIDLVQLWTSLYKAQRALSGAEGRLKKGAK